MGKKDGKLVTGHDYAAYAQSHGAKKVSSWGGQGPNNYYRVQGKNDESIVFPSNKVSRGSGFNILNFFIRAGLILFIGGPCIIYIVAEAASRGLIK